MSSFGITDVFRTTVQNKVPLRAGKVLGMYSSPRFLLKSYNMPKLEELKMGEFCATF